MGKKLGIVLAALAATLGLHAAAWGQPTVITIDTASTGPKIERDIFGQFAEHLGTGIYGGVWVGRDSKIPNVRGVRSDVVAALRALKVPNVRWPGGCFADEYHWRDGIGPAAARPARLNTTWGGVIETNAFGTHEFMDFLGQIGAEAYLSVNVGSGSPLEAGQWLEYLTADKPTTLVKERVRNGRAAPWRIKYLGLGNENWGCGGSMSGEHYVEEMKRFSRISRNDNPAQQSGEGTMKRIAVGSDGDASDYTEQVMQAWKSKVWAWDIEGVSLHRYVTGGWPPHLPSTSFGEDDYATLVKDTLGMDAVIARQSAIMDRYDPDRKLILSVDEWGVWLSPAPGTNPGFLQQQNSLRDAITAALHLNIFMRHAERVRMANIAQMANVLQAMILTKGPMLVLTPTYHVFRLYTPFQDATRLPVSFDAGAWRPGIPRLDAVAARGKDGRLWLAITNIDPDRPAEIEASLPGAGRLTASGEVLTAARVDAVNDFGSPQAVAPHAIQARVEGRTVRLTLPPKSVTVLGLSSTP